MYIWQSARKSHETLHQTMIILSVKLMYRYPYVSSCTCMSKMLLHCGMSVCMCFELCRLLVVGEFNTHTCNIDKFYKLVNYLWFDFAYLAIPTFTIINLYKKYFIAYVFLLLQQAYLPTMPQGALPEARRALGGSFYGNNT